MSARPGHPFVPMAELDSGARMPTGPIAIDMGGGPTTELVDGIKFSTLSDGGMEIDFDPMARRPDGMQVDPNDPDANLAEVLSESDMAKIAQDVEEWVDIDTRARAVWFERLASGLELLGISLPEKAKSGPVKEVREVNHPLIAEAQIQFQARSIAEIVPPEGPAKAVVLGDKTKDRDEQAERVAAYLNYQLMVEDKDFFQETDRLLFVLSGEGSQFKKVYRDHLEGRNVSRWCRGEDVLVPYGASSLHTTPRITHIVRHSQNNMRKLQVSGFYRDVDLPEPTARVSTNDRLKENRDQAQGQSDQSETKAGELEYTVYECYCDYDLPGFEDEDPDTGEPTGVALPYIISVEKDSRKVLAIRRNWKAEDQSKRRRTTFVHYSMFPGDGFYSYGYWHFIGGLGKAATGLLKTIMVGAAFASMQGGFAAAGGRNAEALQIEWGKYKPVDMSWEELSRAFYTPPFKEPSEALFKVLGLLEVAAQRLANTTESMVGDASNTGPVGTTVALIEQGSKVYTGIHKRLHMAMGEELRLLSELNGEYLPEEGYPYDVAGGSRWIYGTDFDDRVDVVPVSDPNIFSSTQRIAIAQTVIQRASERPDLYNQQEAELRFLKAMRVPDPEGVLAKKGQVPRADPLTENALLMVGRPVKAFLDQDHDAHMMVLQSMIDQLAVRPAGDPIAQRVLPAAFAHLAEHMALGMRVKVGMAMGIPLPMLNLDAEDDEPLVEQVPPQIENAIAQRAAMAVAQMPKPQGSPDPAQMEAQAKALQQQAEALQQESEKLAAEREAVKQMADGAAKDLAQANHEREKAALANRVAELERANNAMRDSAKQQSVVEAAVKRVEQALEALRQEQQQNEQKKQEKDKEREAKEKEKEKPAAPSAPPTANITFAPGSFQISTGGDKPVSKTGTIKPNPDGSFTIVSSVKPDDKKPT